MVRQDEIEILLSRTGLAERLGVPGVLPPSAPGEPIRLVVAARLNRLGGETCLIIRDQTTRHTAASQDASLIEALVQAHTWRRSFEHDPTIRMSDFAEERGVSDRYAARMLRLAYLAPDVCESILQGTQPRLLTLKKLLREIPLSWQEQRREFRFLHT